MKADQPVRVSVSHGDSSGTEAVEAGFADLVDALSFLHLQARAAVSAGHTTFHARMMRGTELVDEFSVTSHDLCGAVRSRLHDHHDDQGLVTTRVPGIDAIIYAHRSCLAPEVLLIGVDADEDQRILFVVNEADLVDTTVGVPTGTLDLRGTPNATMTVGATVAAANPQQARAILESVVSSQPIHFHPLQCPTARDQQNLSPPIS